MKLGVMIQLLKLGGMSQLLKLGGMSEPQGWSGYKGGSSSQRGRCYTCGWGKWYSHWCNTWDWGKWYSHWGRISCVQNDPVSEMELPVLSILSLSPSNNFSKSRLVPGGWSSLTNGRKDYEKDHKGAGLER